VSGGPGPLPARSSLLWERADVTGVGYLRGANASPPHAVPALDFAELRQGPGLSQPVEPTHLPADTAGMAKKPEPPPKPIRWGIYKIAAPAQWLGIVEAPDETSAIEKGATEFKVPANRLMAIRR
jgi:hypothetical protein